MYRVLFILLFASFTIQAQNPYFFPEDVNFDPNVPSPEQFLGYSIGSHHTRHDKIVAYMQKLAEVSDRASFQKIGQTYEHRDLVVLTITSPANHNRLEEIRQEHLKLVDPKQNVNSFENMPSIVLLGYNVHGNEPSSSEAAMLTAYYYTAAQSQEVSEALENAVLMVDPVFNPDGRDRHSNWVNMHKGDPLVADPLDREHNEVWPGGRTNHYWYDLNRDWLPLAHVESQARIDFYHKWYPNVVTDFHEMGTNSTYFFEPTKPFGSENIVVPRDNYEKLNNTFARYFHEALDETGSLYYTKENFDNSYPGYGSTYPDIHGGLGLVFEQASSRGHLQDSRMGEVAFPFTIKNHFTSSLATVKAAVNEREMLLEHMKNFFNTAVEEAEESKIKGYVFGLSNDEGRNKAFVDLLLRHKIKTFALEEDVTANGKEFKKEHAFFVPTDQPQYRMVRTMFEKVTEFYDSIFYDASAWTAVLAYGIPYQEFSGRSLPQMTEVNFDDLKNEVSYPEKTHYAYIIDWSDYRAAKALNYLLQEDLYVNTSFKPFQIETDKGKKDFGRGSLVIPVRRQDINEDALYEIIKEAADKSGVSIQSVKSGFSSSGVDLGSNNVRTVEAPKVLMPIGKNFSSYEAGEIWHLLDSKIGMAITKVDINDFNRVDLSDYNTMVVVSTSTNNFNEQQLNNIKEWVRKGNTLITLRAGTNWAIQNELTTAKLLEEEEKPEDKVERRDFETASDYYGSRVIGGSMYMTDVDNTHPLGFGYATRELPVYRNHSIMVAPSENPFNTVVQYQENPLLSGYINKENLKKLPGTASLLVEGLGRGRVIMFADNPSFRGMWYGTNRLFFNALFFGSLISSP
ncbi:MAG: M14 family zinc carboxypeptidase [Candidatus Cyclobacteriaceae bacterium M2_1C_046]